MECNPGGVEEDVCIVACEEQVGVHVGVPNVTVTPVGKDPLVENVTGLAGQGICVAVAVGPILAPATTLPEFGETLNVKSNFSANSFISAGAKTLL